MFTPSKVEVLSTQNGTAVYAVVAGEQVIATSLEPVVEFSTEAAEGFSRECANLKASKVTETSVDFGTFSTKYDPIKALIKVTVPPVDINSPRLFHHAYLPISADPRELTKTVKQLTEQRDKSYDLFRAKLDQPVAEAVLEKLFDLCFPIKDRTPQTIASNEKYREELFGLTMPTTFLGFVLNCSKVLSKDRKVPIVRLDEILSIVLSLI